MREINTKMLTLAKSSWNKCQVVTATDRYEILIEWLTLSITIGTVLKYIT